MSSMSGHKGLDRTDITARLRYLTRLEHCAKYAQHVPSYGSARCEIAVRRWAVSQTPTGQRPKPPRRRWSRWMCLIVPMIVVIGLLATGSTRGKLNRLTKGAVSAASALTHPSAATAIDPSYFASGACMSFPPANGDRHLTVFLDAGHGGLDPGGVGETTSGQQIEESTINLSIELDTMQILREEGFRVVVSRTENTTVIKLGPGDTDGQLLSLQGSHDDVAARDVCANKADADLLVGIYMDAGGSPDNAGSVATYDTDRPFSSANLKFATFVQKDVLNAMNDQGWNIPNDGVVSDATEGSSAGNPAEGGLAAESADYDHLMLLGPASPGYFSTPSNMPGAVIEPFFLTDPFEGSIADSTSGQEVVAKGIASAITQYFAPASTHAVTSTTG
jgi:N-acetylmuramoyl-L-alanine amidase